MHIFWPTACTDTEVTVRHLPERRLNAGFEKKKDRIGGGGTNVRQRLDERHRRGRETRGRTPHVRRRDGRQRSRRSGRFGGYGITAVRAAVRRRRHRTRLLSTGHVRACTEPAATAFLRHHLSRPFRTPRGGGFFEFPSHLGPTEMDRKKRTAKITVRGFFLGGGMFN